MSKLARYLLAAALVFAMAPGFVRAQAPAVSVDSAAAKRAAGGLAVPEELLGEVAKLRELAVLRQVPSGLKSRDDIRAIVLKDMAENASDEELQTATSMLRFLGLVEANFDLRHETVSLLTEQIAGFYDPKTKIFYLADWIALDEQRTVIVHELTHALTDQHFDLRRLENWPDGDGDAELAARALVEGDATALMVAHTLFERGMPHQLGAFPLSLTDLLKRSVEDSNDGREAFNAAPKVLRESLQFPYVYGAGFVQRLLREGEWTRVSDAYRALPASTEQIMHPEKYLKGELPVKVELPDVSSSLGAGYRRVDRDVNGEFGYYLVLESKLGEQEAVRAAAGWGGDRYNFYVDREGGRPVLVHESAWDTESDAAEFFAAYTERTRLRVGAKESGAVSATVREWTTPEGLFRIERTGTRVLALEGFRGSDPKPLLARLRQQPRER